MAKYRFKKEFEDSEIALPGHRGLITKSTLTDVAARKILKIEKLKHNIELIPTGESPEPVSSELVAETTASESSEPVSSKTEEPSEDDVKPASKAKAKASNK